MVESNPDNLNQKILDYFKSHFKDIHVNVDTKLIDLGFESIDYIALATFLFERTGAWLDSTKINNDTKISNISSSMVYPEPDKPNYKKMVRLDEFQKYLYAFQFEHDAPELTSFIIHYLCLKEDIDLAKLERAIAETLNNHFILNSKLIRIIDDYFFESTTAQSDFSFKGSRLFPKRDIDKLKIHIRSDRLVKIYLQRKNKRHYLIISFHHVAMDGWSHKLIQEEIFRRYAGLFKTKKKQPSDDISALNKIYPTSINTPSNTDELRALFESINLRQYTEHLNRLFQGKLVPTYHCFVISKQEMDNYARINNISDFPYHVILTFMFYQIMRGVLGVHKLIIYSGLSNRYLPISGIKELITNAVNGLPLFLDNNNGESKDFAATISNIFKIYFKHMSYGATTRILLENDTILNTHISPFHQPGFLLINYINNISKIIYGNNSIVSNYVDLNQTKTIIQAAQKMVFFDVHNMGNEFLIQIHSRAAKSLHLAEVIPQFFRLNFPH